jgi:hypothetical protein
VPETTYTDSELGLEPGELDQLDPNIRRELRQARVDRLELTQAKEALATRDRQDAFRRAGVPDDDRGQFFAEGYKGSTDPAEVKAAFDKLFIPAPTGNAPGNAGEGSAPTGQPAPVSADQRIAEAAAAGTSQGVPGTVELADAIRAAKTNEEVLEIIRNAPPEAGIRLAEQ